MENKVKPNGKATVTANGNLAIMKNSKNSSGMNFLHEGLLNQNPDRIF